MKRVNAAVNGLIGLGVALVFAVSAGFLLRAFIWSAGI